MNNQNKHFAGLFRALKREQKNSPQGRSVRPNQTPRWVGVESLEQRRLLTGSSTSQLAGGFTPSQVAHAYGIDQVKFNGVVGDGTGQVIAIIDAFGNPNAAADLKAFDANFGIPDPPQFVIANQDGGQTPLPGPVPGDISWSIEVDIDVEWAHAMAPGASILLVEANSASDLDLATAISTAKNTPSVSVISMSFGVLESSIGLLARDSLFTTPTSPPHIPITFLADTGDFGVLVGSNTGPKAVQAAAASPNVIAVGGTRLFTDAAGNWVSESGWSGSGGGITSNRIQPSYQQGFVALNSTNRTVPDVSIIGDPVTGVSVYDSLDFGAATPWVVFAGTSLSTPIWGAIIAIADQGSVAAGHGTLDGPSQTLPRLYAAPSSDYHDIVSGDNSNPAGSGNGYTANSGYDLVTGLGTPIVNLLIPDLIKVTLPAPTSFALAATSDTGTSNSDGLTNVSTPVLTGIATPGAVITIFSGTTQVATGTANGTNGTFSISLPTQPDGFHVYYSTATVGTQTSTRSANVTLTIDTVAPAAPSAPVLSTGGNKNVGGKPLFNGTAPVGSIVRILNGSTVLGSGTTNASGAYSIAVGSGTVLSLGDYTITAVALDAAGNTSPNSGAFSFSVVTGSATVTLTTDNLNVAPSANLSFTTTVTSAVVGAGLPTGTVTLFAVSGTTRTAIGAPVTLTTTGVVTFTVSLGSGAGTLDFVVDYSGDPVFPAVSSNVEHMFIGSNHQRYVNQLYRDLFGRDADTGGLGAWTNAMDTGTSFAAVATALTSSREYDGIVVDNLYFTLLGRHAESGGLTAWVDLMQKGLNAEVIRAGILGSDEYYNRTGPGNMNGTDATFITALYKTFLGRAPDAGGLAAWEGLLNNNPANRNSVASGISNSDENRTVIITGFYQTYLHRNPDAGGLVAWKNLLASGISQPSIISFFVTTTEYLSRNNITNS